MSQWFVNTHGTSDFLSRNGEDKPDLSVALLREYARRLGGKNVTELHFEVAGSLSVLGKPA